MKTYYRSITRFTLFILLLSYVSCSGNAYEGGSEAGNPNFRIITGSVTESTVAFINLPGLRSANAATACPADTIIAVDTTGTAYETTIETDCSFELSLSVGESYSINFALNEVFVATMIFQASSSVESTQFVLTNGVSAVDMGIIEITGIFATPQNNPYEQNDQDDDGLNDFEDLDDDEDGISDEKDYIDCDGDGFVDDDECESEDEKCDEDDADCDDVKDDNDNCPDVANEDQADENDNDIGDACE